MLASRASLRFSIRIGTWDEGLDLAGPAPEFGLGRTVQRCGLTHGLNVVLGLEIIDSREVIPLHMVQPIIPGTQLRRIYSSAQATEPAALIWFIEVGRRFVFSEAMPRYRFHLVNDTSSTIDEEGVELRDLEEVRTRARAAIADIVAEEIRQGRDEIHLAVMVDGEDDVRVANFRSTVKVVASESPFAQ